MSMTESIEPNVLVTGATDGLGRETALALARKGFRVILHGRSEAGVRATQDAIARQVSGAKLEHVQADLQVLSEVRRAVTELTVRLSHLDVIINNAGIYASDAHLTIDGWESTFGVNHVASFVLTLGLLPLLRRATAGRVVNVSSVAHSRGRIEPATFRSLERFDPYHAYAQSKLANILFTTELQRREPKLAVNALHPGVVSTKLLVEGFKMNGPDTLAEGAETSVWLASAHEAAALHGSYCVRSRPTRPSTLASDADLAKDLWALTEHDLQ